MMAPNSKVPRRCPSCSSDATLWLRQSPDFWHAFRVECSGHHFLKWGTEGQLEEARRRGLDVVEVPYQSLPSSISEAKNNQAQTQASGI